ncbi:hypothetical protein ACTPEM_23795, partial [Clostridioides difficile]
KAYKSQANFILFYSEIENLSQKLIDRGVLIRKFGGKLENYYRFTFEKFIEQVNLIPFFKHTSLFSLIIMSNIIFPVL